MLVSGNFTSDERGHKHVAKPMFNPGLSPMWLRRLICALRFHKLSVIATFGPNVRCVYCSRCDQLFGMHDGREAFVEWDDELESLHCKQCWDELVEKYGENWKEPN